KPRRASIASKRVLAGMAAIGVRSTVLLAPTRCSIVVPLNLLFIPVSFFGIRQAATAVRIGLASDLLPQRLAYNCELGERTFCHWRLAAQHRGNTAHLRHATTLKPFRQARIVRHVQAQE